MVEGIETKRGERVKIALDGNTYWNGKGKYQKELEKLI